MLIVYCFDCHCWHLMFKSSNQPLFYCVKAAPQLAGALSGYSSVPGGRSSGNTVDIESGDDLDGDVLSRKEEPM